MKLNTFQFEIVTVDDRGEEIDRRLSEARSFLESIDGVLLEMVVIPGGNLEIEPSNPKFKGESLSREYPQHHVTVPSLICMETFGNGVPKTGMKIINDRSTIETNGSLETTSHGDLKMKRLLNGCAVVPGIAIRISAVLMTV